MAIHEGIHRGFLLAFAVGMCGSALSAQPAAVPRLVKQGGATQLVVDGRPFLIRGGEIGNSSASNLTYLAPHWARFRALRLNTILAPVYWELLEPKEGTFDFALVDGLVAEARTHDLRLVLLWFGSWKNSMSCYAPAWVKQDQRRFPRSVDASGQTVEILSAFSAANRDADARAFAALLKHLRAIDGDAHTVVMVQVENEIGMIPSARDHSEQAARSFGSAVPGELMAHLVEHADTLAPEPAAGLLAASYDVVAQLTPLIVEHQGRGTMAGLLQEHPDNRQPQQLRLNGYVLDASFERTSPPSLADGAIAPAGAVPGGQAGSPAGGLVVATGPNEFLFAGIGVTVTFATSEPGWRTGILSVEEGRFVDGTWENRRWLNGDQTHQGRHVRLEPGRLSIQRVRLYRYR
jgi:beta-galactosidase GanA